MMAGRGARRAIIVCGPQSSGTRMLTRAVESAGFEFLDLAGPLSPQKIDGVGFTNDVPLNVVLHRSLPSGSWWPDFDALFSELEARSFIIQPLAIHRDWHSTIHSLMYRSLAYSVEGAERQLRRAWQIASSLPDVIFVSYEEFVGQPEARFWLFVERLGIAEPTIEFRDENAKHYDPKWPPPGAPRGDLP